MERMTRSMIAAWQPANPLVEPTRAERLAQEALTLMDERDACARRLAAATALLQDAMNELDGHGGCCSGIRWTAGRIRAFLTEAPAPHGPGAPATSDEHDAAIAHAGRLRGYMHRIHKAAAPGMTVIQAEDFPRFPELNTPEVRVWDCPCGGSWKSDEPPDHEDECAYCLAGEALASAAPHGPGAARGA